MQLARQNKTTSDLSMTTLMHDQQPRRYATRMLCNGLRYPGLLKESWHNLPTSIQKRFIKTAPPRDVLIYHGRIHETRMSRLGYWLCRLCLLIGSPLPQNATARGPATVIVREAKNFNGQFWTRIYPGPGNLPQVITTLKRFDGPTGLEEWISEHLGISLSLRCGAKSLTFTSDDYFYRLWKWRLTLPRWLSPGELVITHRETGPRRFRYTLSLQHRWFGELVYQTAIFEEVVQC